MKNIYQKLSIIALAFMLSACSKTTTVRRHPSFSPDLLRSKTISVFPSTVEAVTVEASGKSKRNYEYEAMVEDVIIDVLRPHLMEMGYNAHFVKRRDIHNKKLSGKVLSFREQYADKIAELYQSIEWKTDEAHNIEIFMKPEMELSNALGSDLILITEYHLRSKSSGACAKDFVLAMFKVRGDENPDELLSLRVAIIDPKTGYLIWSNFRREGFASISGIFSKSAQSLETSRLKDSFKELLKELSNNTK